MLFCIHICNVFLRERYGEKHPKYADALADYGFYLLSIDWIHQAVEVQ